MTRAAASRAIRTIRAFRLRLRLPKAAPGRPLGGGYEMKPLTRAGLDAIARWLGDPKVSRYFDFGGGRHRLDRDEITLFLCARSSAVAVIHAPAGDPLGCFAVLGHGGPSGTATGIFLRRPGAALEARVGEGAANLGRTIKRAALEFIFEQLGVQSLNVWTVETNLAALRLNRSLGLRECGRMPSSHVIDGTRHDRLLFSMTAQDFADIRARWPPDGAR